MLPEKEVKKRVSKFDRPLLPEPITYRVVFRKTGNLQYFSHLDLQRTWQRVLVRASIPMWYTQGFNPHSKIVYGVPLPVGSEGVREMVDLRIDRAITPEEMRDQLNAELTDEMSVSEVYIPVSSFSDIAMGVYEITLSTPGDAAESAERINALFARDGEPMIMTKRTKSGDKEVNILPMIHSLTAVAQEDGTVAVSATLSAGNNENLNPEYVIQAMKDRLGLLSDTTHPETCWYRILRTGFLRADGTAFR